jgi:hypothetical protein
LKGWRVPVYLALQHTGIEFPTPPLTGTTIMPKYRTHFELDIQDIDRIEASLTQRVGDLSRKVLSATGDSVAGKPDLTGLQNEIQQLRGLLGRIHEQKIWYAPKDYQPRG